MVGEWIAAGRPNHGSGTTDIAVVEVAAAFMKHARVYYRKNGVPTGTADNIQHTLKLLCKTYGCIKE